MTREIRFRAWDRNKKKIYDNIYICPCGVVDDNDKFIGYVGIDLEIMQYTGLKDKNGKEMYEGDILQVNYSGGYRQKRIVAYNQDRFATFDWQDWQDNTCIRETSLGINTITYEVIGNIYESPRLFTKKKQYD